MVKYLKKNTVHVSANFVRLCIFFKLHNEFIFKKEEDLEYVFRTIKVWIIVKITFTLKKLKRDVFL